MESFGYLDELYKGFEVEVDNAKRFQNVRGAGGAFTHFHGQKPISITKYCPLITNRFLISITFLNDGTFASRT